jgi:hypothetical protein
MDSDFRVDEAKPCSAGALSLLSMRKARPDPTCRAVTAVDAESAAAPNVTAGGSDVTGEQTGMKKSGVEAGANLMGKELEIKETQTRPRARPPVGVNLRAYRRSSDVLSKNCRGT